VVRDARDSNLGKSENLKTRRCLDENQKPWIKARENEIRVLFFEHTCCTASCRSRRKREVQGQDMGI
jgi:hypothetical protein